MAGVPLKCCNPLLSSGRHNCPMKLCPSDSTPFRKPLRPASLPTLPLADSLPCPGVLQQIPWNPCRPGLRSGPAFPPPSRWEPMAGWIWCGCQPGLWGRAGSQVEAASVSDLLLALRSEGRQCLLRQVGGNPEPASPGPAPVKAAGTSPPQNQAAAQDVGLPGWPEGTPEAHAAPPPGLSAVQPAGFRSNSRCPLHSHRGLASTEPASGTQDTGERHRSQPSSRPSADIHQRLIYQPPRQPLGLTISATGWLPGAPLAPRSSGVVGGGAHSASQQARGPIPAHMGELHGSHSRPVEEPKAQRPLGPGAAPASA